MSRVGAGRLVLDQEVASATGGFRGGAFHHFCDKLR